MSLTYDSIFNQALNLLGAIEGSDPDTAESNYLSSPTTGSVIGPDFTPSMVQDAVCSALSELVEAIASTPLHPERAGFIAQLAGLTNGSLIPRVDNSGNPIVGVIGTVWDSGDSTPLLHVDVDKVRSFNRFASGIYDDFSPYWYALETQRIYHTRDTVKIDACAYSRPTAFTDPIPLEDHHESGLVMGAVAKLALKESMYPDLFNSAVAAWQAHLASIRAYGAAPLYGEAMAAPSAT